jgi:isopenicillin N synthase-like dioxygenase
LIDQKDDGLQVYHDGEWRDIPAIPDTLVVNGGISSLFLIFKGDYLSVLSKGLYISPLHRVLQPKSRTRLSFVFFFYPDYDEPVPRDEALEKTLSLFADQSSDGTRQVIPNQLGDMLSQKWISVSRK